MQGRRECTHGDCSADQTPVAVIELWLKLMGAVACPSELNSGVFRSGPPDAIIIIVCRTVELPSMHSEGTSEKRCPLYIVGLAGLRPIRSRLADRALRG